MKMTSGGNIPFCTLMGDGQPINPAKELLLWLLRWPRHTLPAIGLGLIEKLPVSASAVTLMRKACDELREEFTELLGSNGVFFYPTHPVPAPYHNQAFTLISNFAYTAIFNVLGLPVTAVPMGLSKEGVPVGLQVVAAHGNDRLCLAVAQELEKAFGGWTPPF